MHEALSVTFNDIAAAHEDFIAERANIVAKNAVTSKGVRAVARVPEAIANNAMIFDIEVKQGERTDQKRSGRCWMFASLNTFRIRIMQNFNLKTFELSQAYPLFFDKLEKCNWFLQNIIDTTDEPLNGRLVSYLLTDPMCDGGQWDMFKSLVKSTVCAPKRPCPRRQTLRAPTTWTLI